MPADVSQATFLPQRSFGPFVHYCVVEEAATDEVEITQHAIQTGAAVSDHIFVKPSTVTIRGLYGPQYGPPVETFAKLRKLLRDREPFDVVTAKAAYPNMVVQRLVNNGDGYTEHVCAFTVELREIRIVSVATVSIPPAEKHANPAKTQGTQQAGKQKAGASSESRSRTAAKALAAAFSGG